MGEVINANDLLCRLHEGELQPANRLPIFRGQVESPIFEGWSHLLAADPKAGKTELVTRIVGEWTENYTIFYATEEPMTVWAERLNSLDFDFLGIDLYFALGDSPTMVKHRLKQAIANIVIIDTVRLLGIEDENDNAKVGKEMAAVVAASRDNGQTLIAVHHNNKKGGEFGKGVSGGHAFVGSVDVVLQLERDKNVNNRRTIKGIGRIAEISEITYEKRVNGDFVALDGGNSVEHLKAAIRGCVGEEWLTLKEIKGKAHETGGDTTYRQALNKLVSDGEFERDPPGVDNSQGKTQKWRKTSSL